MEQKLKQDHYKVKASEQEEKTQYKTGRGAQINTKNRFLKNETSREHIEAIDDWEEGNKPTLYIETFPKTIVNKVESPDVGMSYSMNPYAGCEHGCIYCYARNVHEYWGYSAGLDFEQKILVKKNAPKLLRKFLMHPKWDATPIMLSGNTDCSQPAEQTYRLTRGLLEVCNEFNQPVGILTKNSWILKDKDVLQEMGKKQIVSAMVSITSFNEDLRRTMEPRTTTAKQKLKVINELSSAGVRMGIMMGPMIPGLNEHEMQRIMKAAADNGATFTARPQGRRPERPDHRDRPARRRAPARPRARVRRQGQAGRRALRRRRRPSEGARPRLLRRTDALRRRRQRHDHRP